MKKSLVMLTLLVTILAVSSCSKKTDSQALVPEDAAVVLRLDLMQLGQKSGLSDGESSFVKQLKKQLRDAGLGKELRKQFEDIIDEPSQSGIDLTDPFFFYVSVDQRSEPKEVGLIGTIASQSKLTDLLKAINEENDDFPEVEKDGDVCYIDLKGASFIYTDSWFFVGVLDGDISDRIETLKERAGGKGSLSGNEAYERLCAKDGLAQLLCLYSGFEDVRDFKDIKKMLPEGLELNGVASLTDFTMDNGEASLSAEMIALTDEWKEQLDNFNDMCGDLDGDLAKYVSDKGLSVFANIDLTKYLKFIEKFFESQGVDDDSMEQIKELASSIKGEMVFDLMGVDDDVPLMCGYMSTKNNKLVELIASNCEYDDEFVRVGDNVYAMAFTYDYEDVYDSNGDWIDWQRTPKGCVTFGYKNNTTFMYTGDMEPMAKPSRSFPKANIKGKGFYMNFNFDMLKDMAETAHGDDAQIMREVAKVLDYVELYYEDNKAMLRLVTHESDETPLQTLMKYAEKMMDRM